MQPHLEPTEVESVLRGHHELAVHGRADRQLLQEDVVELGEVAIEGSQVATLDEHVVLTSEHDRAKSIPLGLEQKIAVAWDLFRDLREHGLDGWQDRQ